MEDPPNPITTLLSKPSKPPPSILLAILVTVTLISMTSAFASPLNHHRPSTPLARHFKKLARPTVILISCDGFRFGYQHKTPTPNIHRLVSKGTEAELGLIPVFPSVTIPNHYSIATGLYPAYSGVVNTHFFDPVTNQTFSASNHDTRLWLGEPIWETAAKHGYPAAVMYWAGGEVKKGSWTCPLQFCPKYNGSVPFEERIDTILSYMDLPSEEIPVITALYLPDPDSQGHKWGPDDPAITKAIAHVDKTLGRLISGLEKRGIFEDVTIILLGDHGMVSTCEKKYIFLEDLAYWIEIPKSWVQSEYQILAIQPPNGVDAAEVVAKMNQGLSSGNVTNGDKLMVYLKEDLPARFHYFESDRISSIIGLVAEGYAVEISRTEGAACVGAHGYDNMLFSMRTIFIGHGPQFKKGRKVRSFVNIEVYNLVTTILGLKGAPNNGTDSFASSVLLPSYP